MAAPCEYKKGISDVLLPDQGHGHGHFPLHSLNTPAAGINRTHFTYIYRAAEKEKKEASALSTRYHVDITSLHQPLFPPRPPSDPPRRSASSMSSNCFCAWLLEAAPSSADSPYG